ncbi:hypothetical protein B0H11DRAFT_2419050 [Mycena galericulata]|nr:hypothetical protein B0H11DRAFT_2419050 [Mycena galericulata]
MDDMEEEDEANDFVDYLPPGAPKKQKVSFRVESDDDDEAEGIVAKKNDAKQASRKVGKAVQPPRATLTAQTAKQKKTEQPLKSALTNPKKRKNVEPPAEELAAKKVKNTKPKPLSPPKKSLKPLAVPRQRKQLANPPSLVWDDIPNICPTVMCDDALPKTPNARILSLFVKRQELINEVGPAHREKYIELGKQNQWPQIIDYNTVPARILKLKDSLLETIQDPDVLQTSFIWNNFIRSIDSKIFKFASSASKLAFTDALYGRRCGYYGPKGEFLINSTVLRILSNEEEALSYKLYETLSSIIDEAPDSFDEYDDTSNLIALKDFVAFILTPFTAALLIAEDRGISLEDATDGLQIETKPLAIESKQEVNSKSQLKELKPKPKGTGKPKAKPIGLLSLEDFLEPAPKPKNINGKNKPAGKAKKPSKDVDVLTAGGYGTRSKSKMKSESE